MSGGVRHRFFEVAPGGIGRRIMRNNEGLFYIFSFPLLSILYPVPLLFAITERFRFEYSLAMKALRIVSERLHNSDNDYCNIFLCTFLAFLHNIM